MWIEKREGYFLAIERVKDEITGKHRRISVRMDKDNARTRKAAAAELAKKAEKSGNGQALFSQICDLYFSAKSHEMKPQTAVVEKNTCKNIIAQTGDFIVDNVTAGYISAKLLNCGKPKETINRYIMQIKTVLRWAYAADLTANGTTAEKLRPLKTESRKIKLQDKFLEHDEIEKLLQSGTELFQMLTAFLILTGMRIGEAIALENSDIDFENKTISINKTFSPIIHENGTPKTAESYREIHITPDIAFLIRRIKSFSDKSRMINGTIGEKNLFLNQFGRRLSYKTYSAQLQKHSVNAIGRSITPHALRHTFTSICAEKGVSLDQIARQLGHSNSKVTRSIYLHVTERQKQKDAEIMDKISILSL